MSTISYASKKEIKYYLNCGLSIREIEDKTGISKSAIHRIKKSLKARLSNCLAGRPSKLSDKLVSIIIRGFESGVFKTCVEAARYIQESSGIAVGRETIRSILLEHGFKCYVKVKKPRLTKLQKMKRLQFAKEMILAPEHFWKDVIFTDESKFNLYAPDGYKKVWRLPGIQLEDHHVSPQVKFGGGHIMVWGAITYKGVGALEFIPSSMNAEVFVHTLNSGLGRTCSLFGFNPQDIILQQDNDPKHTSRLAKEYLNASRISVLPWPSVSPDLNPIEHVWNDVNIRIRAAKTQPQNIEELMIAVKREWEATSTEYIKKLFDSMNSRLRAVIAAKGGYTRY
jgi:transposase